MKENATLLFLERISEDVMEYNRSRCVQLEFDEPVYRIVKRDVEDYINSLGSVRDNFSFDDSVNSFGFIFRDIDFRISERIFD